MIIVFVALTSTYLGYSQGFAFFASQVAPRRTVPMLPMLTGVSRSSQEAADLAVTAFGPGHWAVKAPMRYYDVQRGYWIFWKDQVRLNEGKTWEFSPVAIITRSRKDGPLKTITGDKARVDFNRPFDTGKPGEEAARIVHALMRDNVRIRDDKGTPDIADDLTTDPMKSLEFDEAKEHIISPADERVVLRDRGLTVIGFGMEMELRRKATVVNNGAKPKPTGPAAGFDGVKALTFLRDVEIDVQDVGRSGIVPGGSGKPSVQVVTTDKTGTKVAKVEPRPGHIQCSGEMRIDLPRPRRPAKIGPPAPPEPTIATFHKNVRVRQGDPLKPEQMDSDHLVATLMPGDKPTAPKGKAAAEARKNAQPKANLAATTKDQTKAADSTSADDPVDAGPLSGLVLHRAVATGHAVWLQSDSNGLKALGNELRYYRYAPAPDQIFLRADRETEIVKTDLHTSGKDKGKPQSISTIRTRDVTIFQYPGGTRPPSMVARGPGTLETRAAGKDEVERFAAWQDSLQMVSAEGSEQRQLTLTGHPRIRSITQGDISAERTIVADLYPKAKKPGGATVTSADGKPVTGSGDALQIKKLVADGDVHLVTVATPADPSARPPKAASPARQVTARETLTADFRVVDAPASAAKTPGSTPNGTPIIESRDNPTAMAAADPSAPAKPAARQRPAEPAMTAVADRVWALVLQQEGSDKSQIQDAKLTGNVEIHQDSADGKTKGSDITAQAVLLKNSGENRAWVQAFGTPEKHAVASTDARTISGPILTLDQATDHAWVKGAGRLEMAQTDKDFLDDTAPAVKLEDKDNPKAKAPVKPKGPLVITWGKTADDPEAWMNFYGRPADSDGDPGPAFALFHSNVKARTDESALDCENLKATFDAPIAFVKPKKTEIKPAGEKEPGPQIAFLHARGNVDIIARKFDPATGFLKDKKRILHQDVTYEKATGQFLANGPGTVSLYTTSDDDKKAKTPGPLTASAPNRRTVQPVTSRVAADPVKKTEPPKLSLTHVRFNKSMAGRFTPAEDAKPQDYSTATFLGSVEAVMATVPDETIEIDSDRLPSDFYRIVSQKLDVQVEPPPVKAVKVTDKKNSDRVLLDASGGAKAFTPRTAIDGDRITYDSLNELSYVYGGPTGVGVVNQDGAGQPATTGRGSALFHNHKTGLTQLIDPQTFQIIDPSSGQRSRLPTMAPPPPSARRARGMSQPKPPPPARDPMKQFERLRLPGESDKDRRSFSGK